jgi:hypothetical protein
MSLRVFQATLLQLIADPSFRDAVLAGQALDADLTLQEQARLRHIAADRGLDINRTLHKGFRLGKLRAMLPLTCQVLGPKRLAHEVSAFWKERPPSSFYFLPEALDFCDFLRRRNARGKYLREVVAYERATLELERARVGIAPVQTVVFRHDPRVLLSTLAAGRRPRAIAERRCRATGMKDGHGRVSWQVETLEEGRAPARRPRARIQ